MSVDTGDLDRSTLEAKDRAELATIARALGGSPGSRDRKAALVDLVLELASDPSPNGSAPTGPSHHSNGEHMSEQTAEKDPATDDRRDTGGDDAGGPGEAQGTESSGADDGGGQDEGQADKARDDKGRDAGPDARSHENTDRDKKGQGKGGQDKKGQGKGGQDKKGQGKGGQGKGQQGGGQQGGGQPEAGNRKRRRRGRGRGGDRDNEPEQPWDGEPVEVEGLLDLRSEGYGFLRVKGVLPTKEDVYVSVKQVRQFGLRKGDHVAGASRPANRNEKNPALLRIDRVNGENPEKAKKRPRFEDLTPLFPDERLNLEVGDDASNMTARIIDLLSPIGKGQRGLIVSPPKAGKTTVMKQIARSIETNDPDVHLMVLLVDERPEEVTDMRRWIKGEVMASTFDRPSEEHTQVAELAIEKAKRMVESGRDVVIILDGITRLARAYNLAAPATGRIMSGGVDSGALYPPKRFFGAARNLEEGGSLTILATALIETGSKMDEVIFEEFKGTGNMELRLDRKLAERRIYPAIDVDASSTRHEELLFERKQLQQVWKLRRVLSGLADGGNGATGAGLELLIDRMKTFQSNDEFLAEVAKAPSIAG